MPKNRLTKVTGTPCQEVTPAPHSTISKVDANKNHVEHLNTFHNNIFYMQLKKLSMVELATMPIILRKTGINVIFKNIRRCEKIGDKTGNIEKI